MGILSNIFNKEKVDYNELINGGAHVIDVRSKAEFQSGHAKGSRNMPLDEISTWSKKLKKEQVVVLVCQSGGRAGVARRQLKSLGIEAYNAGNWQNV